MLYASTAPPESGSAFARAALPTLLFANRLSVTVTLPSLHACAAPHAARPRSSAPVSATAPPPKPPYGTVLFTKLQPASEAEEAET